MRFAQRTHEGQARRREPPAARASFFDDGAFPELRAILNVLFTQNGREKNEGGATAKTKRTTEKERRPVAKNAKRKPQLDTNDSREEDATTETTRQRGGAMQI